MYIGAWSAEGHNQSSFFNIVIVMNHFFYAVVYHIH